MALRTGIPYPEAIAALRNTRAALNTILRYRLSKLVRTQITDLIESLDRLIVRDNGRSR